MKISEIWKLLKEIFSKKTTPEIAQEIVPKIIDSTECKVMESELNNGIESTIPETENNIVSKENVKNYAPNAKKEIINKEKNNPTPPKIEFAIKLRKNDKYLLESMSEYITESDHIDNFAILINNLLPYNGETCNLLFELTCREFKKMNVIFCKEDGCKLNGIIYRSKKRSCEKRCLLVSEDNIVKIEIIKSKNILIITKIKKKITIGKLFFNCTTVEEQIFNKCIALNEELPSNIKKYTEAVKYLLEKSEGQHQNEFFVDTVKEEPLESTRKIKKLEDIAEITKVEDKERIEKNTKIFREFSQ